MVEVGSVGDVGIALFRFKGSAWTGVEGVDGDVVFEVVQNVGSFGG